MIALLGVFLTGRISGSVSTVRDGPMRGQDCEGRTNERFGAVDRIHFR